MRPSQLNIVYEVQRLRCYIIVSGYKSIITSHYLISGWALVRLLGLEHPLGEDHQQVDAAHHKHAAPEAHHADNYGLKHGIC